MSTSSHHRHILQPTKFCHCYQKQRPHSFFTARRSVPYLTLSIYHSFVEFWRFSEILCELHFRLHWAKPKVPWLAAAAYFTFLSNKRTSKHHRVLVLHPAILVIQSKKENLLKTRCLVVAGSNCSSSQYCLFSRLPWRSLPLSAPPPVVHHHDSLLLTESKVS